MLEMFQRGDLDLMDDEISDKDGPKPIVIERGEKIETLLHFLKTAFDLSSNEKGRLQPSAEQIIIVRNEEEKRELPEELKDFPVFTVVESKGLEFQDVILYNFFGSSEKYQCWNYLGKIDLEIQHMSETQYQNMLHLKSSSHNGLVEGYRYFPAHYDEQGKVYNVPAIHMAKKIEYEDLDLYNYVNDELKALYVAITRAKKTFIVYDAQNHKNRKNIDDVWRLLNVVDFVTHKQVEERFEKVFQIDHSLMRQQFVVKGFEYLRKEQFKNALNCFIKLGYDKCVWLCQAFIKLEEIQQKEYYITMNQHMETTHLQDSIVRDYLQVAEHFMKSEKHSDAALCYFNSQQYSKARDQFLKAGWKKEAAQMNYLLGHYASAATLFFEIEDWYSCLVCKELKGDTADTLEILLKLFQSDENKDNKEKYRSLFIRFMRKYLTECEQKTVKEIEELDQKESAVGNKNDLLENYNKLITAESTDAPEKTEEKKETVNSTAKGV